MNPFPAGCHILNPRILMVLIPILAIVLFYLSLGATEYHAFRNLDNVLANLAKTNAASKLMLSNFNQLISLRFSIEIRILDKLGCDVNWSGALKMFISFLNQSN